MLEYIEDARRALNAKAYYSALCFSLTLPDVCAQVEYPNEKTVGDRYSSWINQFVDTSAFIHDQSMLNGNDFGKFIYKIRCLNCSQRKFGSKFEIWARSQLPANQFRLWRRKGFSD